MRKNEWNREEEDRHHTAGKKNERRLERRKIFFGMGAHIRRSRIIIIADAAQTKINPYLTLTHAGFAVKWLRYHISQANANNTIRNRLRF